MATDSKSRYKVWRATPDSAAGFMTTPEFTAMVGSKSSFIVVNDRGISISGPISMITTGEQVRQGGLFVKMNDLIQMIPSTIVTTVPNIIPFPPIAMVTHVMKTLPFVLAMLAG